MSAEYAALLAKLDQHSARCNELLDELVANMRGMIDLGVDPGIVAVLFAGVVEDTVRQEPAKVASALGYALVQLARTSAPEGDGVVQ